MLRNKIFRYLMKKQILKFFLLLAIFFAVPGFSQAAIVFEDNFNSYTWQSTSDNLSHDWPSTIGDMPSGPCDYETNLPCWYSWAQGAGSNALTPPLYSIDQNVYHGNSGKSLAADYEYSQYINGGSFDLILSNGRTSGYDEIWYQSWLYVPADFNPGAGMSPWKIMHSNTGVNIATENPNSTCDEFGYKRGQQQYFELVTDGNGVWRIYLGIFGPSNGVVGCPNSGDYAWTHGGYSPSATNYAYVVGHWNFVQFHIKLNTFTDSTPNSDGIVEAWIIPDNNMASYNPAVASWGYYDQIVVTDLTRKINSAVLFGNMAMAGTSNYYDSDTLHHQMRLDDFVVSTTQLAPDYVIGLFDSAAPAAPTGLGVE